MSYLALYREWRPHTFREIVGQRHVSKTLVNALRTDKIAHAYLFSGPRGTGKTTTAKILAKALNCDEPDGFEPCNQCPSCASIDQGNAMEVFEIDAASNRGIDEIRDLRDKVKLAAAKNKYKVYIIDEVHMLTTEAFNALLKTLEEPPQRVVFILATTEVHKIPLTILSRVQRFEFQRIATEDIHKRLAEVCAAIGRLQDVDEAALSVIAQKSEGGLRDALSILDQCLILDGPLGVEQVYQVLGMVGETFSAELADALLLTDYAKALQSLSKGVDLGRDPRQILRELLDYLRHALLCEATGQMPSVAPHLQTRLMEQGREAGLGRLLRWIGILLQGEGQLKYAGNARLATELLLIQTIYDDQAFEAGGNGEVSEKLRELEREIRGLRPSPGKEGFREPKWVNNPIVDETAAALQTKKSGKNNEAVGVVPIEPGVKLTKAEGPSENGVSLEDVKTKWPEVLEAVRKHKRSTHAFLMEGQPGDIRGNTLTLVFKEGFSFHRDKVDQAENRRTVEEVLQNFFGKQFTLCNVMEHEAGIKSQEKGVQDLVQKAVDIFGVDMVVVKD
ncbi:MAG: DNA polymerase III subunit gamma/tau [Desulfitobacteriaceae bacterium]